MGFVKTPDEVARLEDVLATPRFVGRRLSVQFRTDPAFAAAVLPPPLTPPADPVMVATVGRWSSSNVGDFAGGMLYVPASHGSDDGAYVLAMYMDVEPPIVLGTTLFGEPKKLASADLHEHDGELHGVVERHGVPLIEVRGRPTEDLGPATTERYTYNVKARSAAGGRGLEEDALLTRTHYRTAVAVQRTGPGSLTLRSTAHDPLGDVPVLEVLAAVYAEEDARAACTTLATIPAATFLPYHLGRLDDFTALDTAPAG